MLEKEKRLGEADARRKEEARRQEEARLEEAKRR